MTCGIAKKVGGKEVHATRGFAPVASENVVEGRWCAHAGRRCSSGSTDLAGVGQPLMMNRIHQTISNAAAIPSAIAIAGATKYDTIAKITTTVTVVPMLRLKTV